MRLSRMVGSLLVSTMLWASTAGAQPIDEQKKAAARALADDGITLYDQGKYADAYDKFDRAYGLVQAPTVGLLAARTLDKLGRLVEASEKYRALINAPLDDKAPEAFKDAVATAEQELKALTPRIPTIIITLENVGADQPKVALDGKELPKEMVGVKTPINPGVHRVEAETPTTSAVQDLKIEEKQPAQAVLTLQPKATAEGGQILPPDGKDTKTKRPPGQTQRILGYVTLGVGGVFTIVGVASGLGAYGTRDKITELCGNDPKLATACGQGGEKRNDYLPLSNKLEGQRTVGTIGIVLGVLGIGGGVALIALAPKAPKAAPEAPAKASIEPWIGLGSAGLRGTF